MTIVVAMLLSFVNTSVKQTVVLEKYWKCDCVNVGEPRELLAHYVRAGSDNDGWIYGLMDG